MKKYILILIMGWLFGMPSRAQVTGSLTTTEHDWQLINSSQYIDIQPNTPPTTNNNLQHIQYRYTTQVGAPKLPVYYLNILLPTGSSLTHIQTNPSDKIQLAGSVLVSPVQPPCQTSEQACDSIAPDPAIYNSNTPYPGQQAQVIADLYVYDYKNIARFF